MLISNLQDCTRLAGRIALMLIASVALGTTVGLAHIVPPEELTEQTASYRRLAFMLALSPVPWDDARGFPIHPGLPIGVPILAYYQIRVVRGRRFDLERHSPRLPRLERHCCVDRRWYLLERVRLHGICRVEQDHSAGRESRLNQRRHDAIGRYAER